MEEMSATCLIFLEKKVQCILVRTAFLRERKEEKKRKKGRKEKRQEVEKEKEKKAKRKKRGKNMKL